MAELKVLVAGRGHCKGSLTKMINCMESELFLQYSIEKLKATKERVYSVFNDYNKYCMQIKALDPQDNEDLNTIEDNYLDLIAYINKLIHNKAAIEMQPVPCTSKIKLPNVVIPTFTGNYTQYYDFLNIFTAMIHNDTTLSPVQKLYYLKGFLSGEPQALIQNLPLQDHSYTEALNLLKERYDNKSKIVQEHINTLLDSSNITRSTPANLRKFISEVKQHLAALRNLGEPVDSWDSIILCILSRKLDMLTSRGFQMERDTKSRPTLKEFLEYLEHRAFALENSEYFPKPQAQRLATHAVVAQVSPSCIYCKSAHRLFQCPSFKMAAPQKRIEFAKTNKLCNICLSLHKGKCKFHFRCDECKKAHNSLLHLCATSRRGPL